MNTMHIRGRGGFTLVEMLAVLAVTGILSTVAVIGFSAATRAGRLRTATRAITQRLSYARQLAITQRGRCGVEFNLRVEPATLHVYKYDDTGKRQMVGEFVKLPVGITLGDTPNSVEFRIEFKATGRATGAGSDLTFTINDTERGKHETVEVAPVTGYPRLVTE